MRRDALKIWNAGLDAVRSPRLIAQSLNVDKQRLLIGNQSIRLSDIRRIAVVGAGKAGAGMAEAVESALGSRLMSEKKLVGWVNVPADCVRTLERIHLHAARPAGVNEPMPEGVFGADKILKIIRSLGQNDLCLCLISGGGSALLPAPADGISLSDKLAVTRHLSAAGANIEQLNIVRKQLSRIKGGGLLRECRAGRLVSLIISDVLGDPLDVIASGPTVPDSSTPQDALAVLTRFSARESGVPSSIFYFLESAAAGVQSRPSSFGGRHEVLGAGGEGQSLPSPSGRGAGGEDLPQNACLTTNLIIGNNRTAVDAAAEAAKSLGYAVTAESALQSEGPAEQVGQRLADWALDMLNRPSPGAGENGTVPFDAACLISGGEPVVKLVDASRRGLGGRNQQLVLAALLQLAPNIPDGVVILSGGTDGEDGPTDAAGAFCDAEVLSAAKRLNLTPGDFLARNDAYHFFDPLSALIRTGPTHTNVCDLRVVLTRIFQKGRSFS